MVRYNSDMEYEFSIAWFVTGLLITMAGGLLMQYHQWVADNFGGGVGSYDRYKLAALITVVVGLVCMVNIHTVILGWVLSALFSGLQN